MKTVYRINTIGCYKPWRSSSEYLLTDKELFDKIVDLDNDEFRSLPAPDAELDEDGYPVDEDNTLAEWLWNRQESEDAIEMPYILAAEHTFYTE